MDIVFSHITALEVLRRWDAFKLVATGGNAVPVGSRMPFACEVEDATRRVPALSGATLPLHVTLRDGCARHRTGLVIPHLQGFEVPAGATFPLAPGVSCAGPELVALQMSEFATDVELLLLVDELCGYYGIQPHAQSGLVKWPQPLTSIERIERLIDSVGPVRGTKRLRRALENARDRSGSPMESRICHRLEFSLVRGGYGLDVVALNDPVVVERADAALGSLPTRIRKPDILLLAPDANSEAPTPFRAVAVDYQGSYHRDATQESRDINRRNELLAHDIKDYEIAKEHYDDSVYLDWLVSRIRHDLGIPAPRFSERSREVWERRRQALNAELSRADGLHWTRRSEPLLMFGAREFSGGVVAARG